MRLHWSKSNENKCMWRKRIGVCAPCWMVNQLMAACSTTNEPYFVLTMLLPYIKLIDQWLLQDKSLAIFYLPQTQITCLLSKASTVIDQPWLMWSFNKRTVPHSSAQLTVLHSLLSFVNLNQSVLGWDGNEIDSRPSADAFAVCMSRCTWLEQGHNGTSWWAMPSSPGCAKENIGGI